MNAQFKETEATEITLLPDSALANPVELFTRSRLDEVIEQIRAAVQIVPDLDSEAGRKAIAATAYKVARSKTAIDAAGKGMVEGWKTQAKVIDGLRKHAWDTLETLQAEVRAPLTEWEAEQKRIEQEAIDAARIRRETEEAEARADLERREAAVREAEARIAAAAKAEADRIASEQAAAERAEREAAIAADADARARRDAAEAVERAERAAAKAEQDRIDDAAAAEIAQAEAVRQAEARAAQQAEQVERDRKAAEARETAAREAREANVRHRSAINRKAAAAFVTNGMTEAEARNTVTMIASGKIPAVSIAY